MNDRQDDSRYSRNNIGPAVGVDAYLAERQAMTMLCTTLLAAIRNAHPEIVRRLTR